LPLGRLEAHRSIVFADRAHIFVKAGAGGNGVVRFRREKFIPRGGPNGGDGGRGGSVNLVADPQRSTLAEFRNKRRFRAADGEDGGSSNRHGKDGTDVDVLVPPGTLVFCDDELIADLSAPGARMCAAHGGRGGLGNQHFATSTRQTPRFAQRGEPGEERELVLQLKLLADAGIVGAPNAGKSTLLAAVTSAKPKIADYAFTTLEPQLGVVNVDVDASFVLVEVPGLVEGASRGVGLGDQFLRHVERCRVLVELVDGALPPQEALAQLATIDQELAAWNAALIEKPRIIAVSKQDLPDARTTLTALRNAVDETVVGVSAVSHQGLQELIGAMYAAIQTARRDESPADAAVVLHPRPASAASRISVTKEHGGYRVTGEKIERLAAMTDFESPDGRAYFDRVLARSGALRRLEKLGVRPGDIIHVGDREFAHS
jgi:GTPase